MPRIPLMPLSRRRLLAAAPAVLAAPAFIRPASAQAAWPTRPVRLIVRRVRPTPSSQLDLFGVSYTYHAFITDRAGQTLALEADHRRHAEVENAIRDLKYGVGLNHLPSGRFGANAAWLAFNVMAHNLARWVGLLGLGLIATTKTLRRRLFAVVGRLTRSARRVTLHLPTRWPWAADWIRALDRAAGGKPFVPGLV